MLGPTEVSCRPLSSVYSEAIFVSQTGTQEGKQDMKEVNT